MIFNGIADFKSRGIAALHPGAVAILLMEDFVETASTLEHFLAIGFRNILVVGPDTLDINDSLSSQVLCIQTATNAPDFMVDTVNSLVGGLSGRWIYYGFNAEYLFFPFCESRGIDEFLAFMTEERRESVLSYVIDLYAEDLADHRDGVSLETACLDSAGYFAQNRYQDGVALDRQMDIYGGLRWRFEEHVPFEKRRIDRIALFRARAGLQLLSNHTLNDAEMNTVSCPWHHNATAALCSFRAAKALRTNPGSSEAITDFHWFKSQKFQWNSQQLLELGIIEPGQWF